MKKIILSKEEIKEKIKYFEIQNGRLPSSTDFDLCEYLPSSKTMQRKYGGLKSFGIDFRSGNERSEKAKKSMDISNILEDNLFLFLIEKFGRKNVHRESPYGDRGRIRSDFTIFYDIKNESKFVIDIFYPNDASSLTGIINIKLKKFNFSELFHTVYFVNMNKNINVLPTKKNPLPKNVEVISEKQLKEYINSKYI